MKRPAALLDLDGTMTDPFPGITLSIQYALKKLGRDVPEQDDLRWMIGPPLLDSFPVLLGTNDDALVEQAIQFYRERYAQVGKFENRLIRGIPDVLAQLKAGGFFLSVCTSKPSVYARQIVAHFDLDRFFDAQHGAELDGHNSHKADLIRHILTSEELDPQQTVMIGDRLHDVVGALANDIPALGVLWGYGSREELEGSGAAAIAEQPSEIAALLPTLLRR